jgi:hypothetical protein
VGTLPGVHPIGNRVLGHRNKEATVTLGTLYFSLILTARIFPYS